MKRIETVLLLLALTAVGWLIWKLHSPREVDTSPIVFVVTNANANPK